MRGIDVSHWNQLTDLFKYDSDFIIAKLTEGKTVKDYTVYLYGAIAQAYEIPFGVYHFAHPEKNSVIDEVKNVEEALRGFHEKKPEMIAIDIEGNALICSNEYLDKWVYDFLTLLSTKTDAELLIYCSQSTCKRFSTVTANKYGLWVARYRKEDLGYGDVSPWNTARIWQYDSKDVDKNIMYTEGF